MSITLFIIIITTVVSVAIPNEHAMYHRLLFNAWWVKHKGEWWRIFTHAFLHADIFHLALNMFVLYQFGPLLEETFHYYFGPKGPFYFLILYLGGIVFSTLLAMQRHQDNPNYYSVGASGAVSSIVFAFIVFYPIEPHLGLIFLPVHAPPVVFGILYLAAEYMLDRYGKGRVAHDAHLLGALFGMGFTIILDYNLFFRMIDEVQKAFQ